jgi:hypothetical protein
MTTESTDEPRALIAACNLRLTVEGRLVAPGELGSYSFAALEKLVSAHAHDLVERLDADPVGDPIRQGSRLVSLDLPGELRTVDYKVVLRFDLDVPVYPKELGEALVSGLVGIIVARAAEGWSAKPPCRIAGMNVAVETLSWPGSGHSVTVCPELFRTQAEDDIALLAALADFPRDQPEPRDRQYEDE